MPAMNPLSDEIGSRMEQNDLSGINAVVIGGTRGIGKAVGDGLGGRGASVIVSGRTATIARGYGKGLLRSEGCDVRSTRSVADLFTFAVATMGSLDIVINCASSFSPGTSESDWNAAFEADLMGSVRVVAEAVPHLRRSPAAAIVLTSSIVTRRPDPLRPAYGAMKAAVEHFTASAALRHAQDRIRVNCAIPGSTNSDIWSRVRAGSPQIYARALQEIPEGRLAEPHEIAQGIIYLASPEARWVTGQTLVIDGGQGLGLRAASLPAYG